MADALIDAAVKNDVTLVKQLIGTGVDVNGVDLAGYTALYYAAMRGFVECAKVLLEADADVNIANDIGWTPLHTVSANGHVECVKVRWSDRFSFCVDEKTISLSLLCSSSSIGSPTWMRKHTVAILH